jgi:hypothetical protein
LRIFAAISWPMIPIPINPIFCVMVRSPDP